MARTKQNSSISLPHGRKRTISPGFFTDADLLALSPLHRLFFEGLFVYADRAGRLLYRPIDLKIRILPMDAFDPVQGLADLETQGLVSIYQSGPLKVIALKERSWREVQRMHPDEPPSALPAPPSNGTALADPSKTISVIGNELKPPIPVHENASEVPLSKHSRTGIYVPAGSSGSSGSSPPLPPSQAKGEPEERTCTCTRRPCRHDKPDAPPVKPCAACAEPAGAAMGAVALCYACLPLAETWAREQRPEQPWLADVASWARQRREGSADPPQLRLVAGGAA